MSKYDSDERDYVLYLQDMQIAMFRLMKYTENITQEKFLQNNLIMDAVMMNFSVLGEASKKVPGQVKAKYPDLPWKQMYGLRNMVAHQYFGLHNEKLWDIIKNQLPDNKKEIDRILALETQ